MKRSANMIKNRGLTPKEYYKIEAFFKEEEKIFHYDYDFKASTRMTTILRYIWKYRLKKYEAWIEEMANRYTQEIKYLWE